MDCRRYAAFLAMGLLWSAGEIAGGGRVAYTGLTRLDAAQSGWRQEAGASHSGDAAQSAGSHKESNPPDAGSAMHSITVRFDYDFTKTPACSAKVTSACVAKFKVFDISGDKPYLLFSIPVPPNAPGMMKGITATSPRILFAIGRHRIGVSAQMPDGRKSPPRGCKVIIEIKADTPPNPPASH